MTLSQLRIYSQIERREQDETELIPNSANIPLHLNVCTRTRSRYRTALFETACLCFCNVSLELERAEGKAAGPQIVKFIDRATQLAEVPPREGEREQTLCVCGLGVFRMC